MADLSKDEFAAICLTTLGIINTNIHRRKLIYDIDTKKLDSDDPINKAFSKKYQKLYKEKQDTLKNVKRVSELYDDVVEKVTEKVNQKQVNEKTTNSRAKSQKVIDWSERKQQADTLLQEARAEKENLTLQKLAGKLIPVDLVFNILNIHNHDIFATFQNDAENLASVYCDILAGGDRKRLAEITTKLSEKLDNAVRRAKEVSMSSIENAIDEYREVRSRGEKK
jgi:multidrug efflux pump subunit AcrA (membrane-fusion protein)